MHTTPPTVKNWEAQLLLRIGRAPSLQVWVATQLARLVVTGVPAQEPAVVLVLALVDAVDEPQVGMVAEPPALVADIDAREAACQPREQQQQQQRHGIMSQAGTKCAQNEPY